MTSEICCHLPAELWDGNSPDHKLSKRGNLAASAKVVKEVVVYDLPPPSTALAFTSLDAYDSFQHVYHPVDLIVDKQRGPYLSPSRSLSEVRDLSAKVTVWISTK